MGRLSTHVLDTARGRPAAGVPVALHRIGPDGARASLAETVTNADGRTDAPLLAGDAFAPGTYELTFSVGGYFEAIAPGAPFLDAVPLRFTRVGPGRALSRAAPGLALELLHLPGLLMDADQPTRATSSATASIRRTRAGPATRASRCSS